MLPSAPTFETLTLARKDRYQPVDVDGGFGDLALGPRG
jgi:hypothetical protein